LRRAVLFGAEKLSVAAKNPQNPALNGHLGCGDKYRVHLKVGRLQAHLSAFLVEPLESRFGSSDKRHDDFALAGSSGPFDENKIATDDVLIAHGIASDLEGEAVFVSDHIGERNSLRILGRLDGESGCDPSHQGQAVIGAVPGAFGDYVN
jgi:hypothetical protein